MLDAADLGPRLEQLRRNYPKGDAALVADVVHAILASARGGLSATEAALMLEIGALAEIVAATRCEIALLRAEGQAPSPIPAATDELDAIMLHTASATHSILEGCERLDALAPSLPGDAGRAVSGIATGLYEACTFQDITGQRITKVVLTLKAIEAKLGEILQVFHPGTAYEDAAPAAALLNGPQLPQAAMDQSAIDALLASLE